jgi:hypothetical protein
MLPALRLRRPGPEILTQPDPRLSSVTMLVFYGSAGAQEGVLVSVTTNA